MICMTAQKKKKKKRKEMEYWITSAWCDVVWSMVSVVCTLVLQTLSSYTLSKHSTGLDMWLFHQVFSFSSILVTCTVSLAPRLAWPHFQSLERLLV